MYKFFSFCEFGGGEGDSVKGCKLYPILEVL